MKGNAGHMAGSVAGRAQSTAGTVVNRVRHNPMPAALVGAGIAWLTMRGEDRIAPDATYGTNARRWIDTLIPAALAAGSVSYLFLNRGRGRNGSGTSDSRERRADERLGGGTAASTLDRATEAVRSTSRQARDRVGELGAGVQERWATVKDRTGSEFDHWINENPLVLGIAAVAAGATLGLLIPQTRSEDEVMGEARDSLLRMAQEAAQRAGEKVKAAAQDVASGDQPRQSSEPGF